MALAPKITASSTLEVRRQIRVKPSISFFVIPSLNLDIQTQKACEKHHLENYLSGDVSLHAIC